MFKRFLSVLLVCTLVFGLVPSINLNAYAAETNKLTGLTVDGLTVTYSNVSDNRGSSTWSGAGNAITGTATGYKKNHFTETAVSSAVCFTNSSGADATLSFDYVLENGGRVTNLSGDSYSGKLETGADFKVELSSNHGISRNDPETVTLKITNIKLVPAGAAEANVFFKTGEGGTYTVNGTAVNGDTSFTNPAGTDYQLVATPNSEKQFLGWYNEATSKYVGYTSSYTFSPVADATIHPVFVDKSIAIFGVGVARFDDLNDATEAAASGGDKVVYLCNDGTLPAGEYEIPAGVTLLVPYNDANSVHVDAECIGLVGGGMFGIGEPVTYETPEAYRTLTMADGAVITVKGELNVGGKHSPGDGSGRNYSGSPSGRVGMINMLKGSKIVVNENSNLRCWGYIYGAGSVIAKSGATVHENFQFTDFRGGSVTSNLAANYTVFPLSQYYVQNVEVPVTYEYGAKAKVWTSIYMSKQIFSAGVDFIGVGAMFVPAEGGSIVKSYDPNTDRLTIDVNDGGSINPMSLELGGTKIESKEFNLPINSNITVNLKAGTVYVNQSISLLPGAEVHVGKDATLELSAGTPSQSELYTGAENLFVYSYDQWTKGLDGETFEEVDGYFVLDNLRLNPVKYSPTRTHNRTENDLKVGATLDINGTFIANGFLYSTKSGGNITSSEKTGKVIFNNGVGQDMFTAQAKQSATNLSYIYIETVPAMLKNADASYTNTATLDEDKDGNPIFVTTSNSNAWAYCSKCDKWAPMVTISFNKGDGNGSMNAQSVTNCGCYNLNANKFTKEGYSFVAWKDAAGKTYEDEAVVNFDDNVTLTATFEEINKAVTVTWMVNGTSYQKEENKGDIPTCVVPEDKLAKASDATSHYTFKGWSYQENGSIIDNFTAVDRDITIYAVFDVANHEDTDDDHYCNTCSYKMSDHSYDENVWAKDADGHWHECTLCGNRDAYAAHTGGTATCTKKAECSICREQYGEKNANNHTKGKIWSVKNETQHKQEWECCHAVTVALENHNWVNGVCDDCEYVRLHTVNFDSNGGSAVSPKTDVKWSDKVLEDVTTPTAPKEGFVFNGWKFGDTAVTDNTTYGELAGQTATSITLKAQWKDVYAPTGEIKLGENKWTNLLNKITFGLFYKETQEFTITASDNSGENVEIKYFLSETALSDNEVESAEYVKYTGKVSLSPDQKVIVYAKLTDGTGNTSYICSNGLVFDGTAPVVTGVTNGTTYCAAQTVNVADDNLEKVTVNGNTVTLNADGQFTLNPAEGTQEIVAVDKAGNISAKMIVTVKDGHFGGEATCVDKAVCEACQQPYGETDPDNHTKGKIWSVKNETQHKQEWECCHAVTVALENHNWVNGVCDDCEYVRLHTVNFDSNGGSAVSPKTDVKWSDKVLEDVTTPTAPKEGFVFDGWTFGDTAVTDNTTYGELAGQTATSITLKAQWKDIAAPTGEIQIGEDKWTGLLNKITFGLFYKETQEFTITASDNSGENVEIKYFLSETALSDNEVESAEYVKYTGKVSLSPDQKVIVYAKLTDGSGNTTYISTEGLVFDATAPVVTGVANGETYCAAQTVTVKDDNLDTVTVNGNTVTLNADGQFTLSPAEDPQEIIAVDKAGNISAKMIVTVKDGHFGGEATCVDKAVCEACQQPYGELKQHALTHINPNPANCIREGNIEYWNCSECKQNFADLKGTTVVNDVTTKVDSQNHTGNTICVQNASDNSKHDVKCSDCQQILRTEAHKYVNGKCQCEITQKITISFDTNGDGIIDETTHVDYDQIPTAPLNPEKSADDNFTYTFKGWNKELVKAHEDTTYTATFYRTGWLVGEGGRQYIEKDVPLTGWQTIAGKQFYFDNETKYAATGVVRVAYPEGFGPNADDVAYEESHGREFKDKTTVLCVFDEATGAFKNGYTGIINYAGANRWASNGMIQWHPGLVAVSDDIKLDYYYFLGDSELGGNKMVTGEQVIYRNNTTFEVAPNTAYYFGLDGKLMLSEDGVRLGEDGKIHYYKDGTIQAGLGLIEYDGSYIYVASNGVVCTGKVWVSKTNDLFKEGYYYFDETGKMIENGVFADAEGTLHYYVNGKIQYGAGLVAYGDSYIYVSSNGKVCTGEVWVSNTNGLVNEGRYTFGEDGKLIDGIKSGVFADKDGVLHYYIDGKLQSGLGLVAYEDGYIYVSSNGKVCTGEVWVSNTNGLVNEGKYAFGEDGKMLGVLKTGIFTGEDGVLHYYSNGKLQYGLGLIAYEDSYIYVTSKGEVCTGKAWVSNTNGHVKEGWYIFDENGLMVVS